MFSMGGGIFDITVVDAKLGQTPTILVSDCGDIVGGLDVDRKFLEFVEKVTSFQQSEASEKEKSLIYSRLLSDFQREKEERFGKN